MRKPSKVESELGVVIAEREYRLGRKQVLARIGMPVPHPSGQDWVCPVQVTAIGDDRVHQVFGIDALQALQLSFLMLRRLLLKHEERLSFLGEKGGVCIARHVPALNVPGYGAAMDQIIEGAERLVLATLEHSRKRK